MKTSFFTTAVLITSVILALFAGSEAGKYRRMYEDAKKDLSHAQLEAEHYKKLFSDVQTELNIAQRNAWNRTMELDKLQTERAQMLKNPAPYVMKYAMTGPAFAKLIQQTLPAPIVTRLAHEGLNQQVVAYILRDK